MQLQLIKIVLSTNKIAINLFERHPFEILENRIYFHFCIKSSWYLRIKKVFHIHENPKIPFWYINF